MKVSGGATTVGGLKHSTKIRMGIKQPITGDPTICKN